MSEDKTHLEEMQSQKDELITQLNEGLSETQKIVTDKTLQIAKVEKEKRLLQREKMKAEDEIRTLEETLQTREKTVAEQTLKISTLRDEKRLLEMKQMTVDEEIKNLKENLEKRDKTVTEQNLKISKVEEEKLRSEEKHMRSEEEIRTLKEDYKNLERKTLSLLKDKHNLEDVQRQKDEEIKTLKGLPQSEETVTEKTLQISKEKPRMEEKHMTVEEEIRTLNEDYSNLERKTEAHASTLIKVEEEKSRLEEKHMRADEEIKTLREDYNNLEKKTEEQTSTLIKDKNLLEELQMQADDEIRKLTEGLSQSEKTVKDKTLQISKINYDLHNLEVRKKKLEEDVKDLKETLARDQKKVKEQVLQMSRLEENKRTSEEEIEKLKLSLSNKKRTVEEQRLHLSRVEKENERMTEKNMKVEEEIRILKETLKKREKRVTEQTFKLSKFTVRLLFRLKTFGGILVHLPQEVFSYGYHSLLRVLMLEKNKRTSEEEIEKLKLSLSNEKRTVEEQRLQILRNQEKEEKASLSLNLEKRHIQENSIVEKERASKMEGELDKTKLKLDKLEEKLEREKAELQMFVKKQHMGNTNEGMMARFEKDIAECDNASVIAPSDDSGFHSSFSETHYSESMEFGNYEEHQSTELKVAVTVTSKGANMHIPDTGVEIDIPTGAIRDKAVIEMTIIPFDKLNAPVSGFSSNSSVAVDLHPNRMVFQTPVRLTLPHCLHLKKDYKKTQNSVKVFMSHHEKGPPQWEEDSNTRYLLDERNCTIYLKTFCWVKYEINNKIVVGKRLKVFTAGKYLEEGDDLAEMEVGYHMDLPGRKENLGSGRWKVSQRKSFIFLKEGGRPLQIFLTKTVPMHWKYITSKENPKENRKTISFKSIEDEKETSCPFAFEKEQPTARRPYCLFKINQGTEEIELSYRF